MKTRKLLSFNVVLVCLVGSLAACVLRVADKRAPSFELSLETDYDVKRWGGEEKSGRAATPPKRKRGDADHSGKAFRIRGQFSNTFTWYDADGSLTRAAFDLADEEFPEKEVPVKTDGWRYRGRLVMMPGFAFGGDKVFVAGLIGLEGIYLAMDLTNAGDSSERARTEFGWVGVPIGFHVEGTLGHVVTPLFTYAYAPTISSHGLASRGGSSAAKLGMRLWPGSLISALGSFLWLEGGWQWTNNEGASLPRYDYEIRLDGPYGAIGWRF